MSTKFFTNHTSNSLISKFKGIFKNNISLKEFDVLVGYFYASGYFNIRPHLENIPKIRILVGIRVDAIVAQAQKQGLLPYINEKETKEDYSKQFKEEISEAPYNREIEKSFFQFIEDIKNGKIEIKAHSKKKLHAKIYIFRPIEFNKHSSGEVITGSSNLTANGLGQGNNSNYEFNVLLRDYDDVKFATDEFEKLWEESIPLSLADFEEVKNKTFLGVEPSPYETYMKFLIEYFGKDIDYNPNNIRDLPKDFKRLSYQIDAVNQGYEILKRHNGFFLADVVGLGKTVVAVLIARQFYFMNNCPEYRSKTLVVTPPSIRSTWEETIEKFDLSDVTYTTNGSLHKITNPEKYDLIIVDESHKFRSDTAEAYKQLQTLCKTPCSNEKAKKVILISATPLNNKPDDILNQVLLFQDSNQSTLDIHLGEFFKKVNSQYKEIKKLNKKELNISQSKQTNDLKKIQKLYQKIRNKVIEPLTVRRTRSDLMEHSMYREDLQKQGINFPKIDKPKLLYYPLDGELNTLYDLTLKKIHSHDSQEESLTYTRYKLINYLKPQHKKDYQNAENTATQLAGIMKSLLLKRLDSSFDAFYRSLERFIRNSKSIIQMFENNRIIIAPNIKNVGDYILDNKEEEFLEILEKSKETDPSIKILQKQDFEEGVQELLIKDHQILLKLKQQWEVIIEKDIDPKWDEFYSKLDSTLLNKTENPSQKLIIFSESKETTDYLYKKISEKKYQTLSINSSNRQEKSHQIEVNFDANISKEKQQDNYKILITTEVLAEGVNLHRSNTIVNYDTPWNATRLMQRIGRINRIGTTAKNIRIFNFLPTKKVEQGIGLKQNAQIKLQAFHVALGEDSQIYTDDEEFGTFGLFDKTQPEEISSEQLNYLMKLRAFREDNREWFKKIKNMPFKIRNAVVNKEKANQSICYLQNKKKNEKNHAFYLIDQEIEELGFIELAKILECPVDTPSAPLPEKHHNQVNQALDYFQRNIEQKIIQETQQPSLNNKQISTIKYLSALQKETENTQLSDAISLIEKGSIKSLEKDLSKLMQNNNKTPMSIEKQLKSAIDIINKRAPHQTRKEESQTQEQEESPTPSNPKIVISQSYVSDK